MARHGRWRSGTRSDWRGGGRRCGAAARRASRPRGLGRVAPPSSASRGGADRGSLCLIQARSTPGTRGLPDSCAPSAPRRAANVINYLSAVCCTSVTTLSCRTFSRTRGVFIFVRNFSRGIFLRDSLSKVVEVLTACAFVSHDEIKGASSLGARAREITPEIPHS